MNWRQRKEDTRRDERIKDCLVELKHFGNHSQLPVCTRSVNAI